MDWIGTAKAAGEPTGVAGETLLWVLIGARAESCRAPALIRRLREAGFALEVGLCEGADTYVASLPLRVFLETHRAGATSGPEEKRAAVESAGISSEDPPALLLFEPDERTLKEFLRGGVTALGAERVSSTSLVLILIGAELAGSRAEGETRAQLLEAAQARGARLLKLGEDDHLWAAAITTLVPKRTLGDLAVLITAGPSREALDPVRFLSNPSSGQMGVAIAAEAQARGAQVTLLLGSCAARPPAGVRVHRFVSAIELDRLVRSFEGESDVVIAAAAVADWRPEEVSLEKQKKQGDSQRLALVRTPDVLAGLSERVRGRGAPTLLVGFAAETFAIENHAREKLERKQLDLIVANNVKGEHGAFGGTESEVFLIDREGSQALPRQTKRKTAAALFDWIEAHRVAGVSRPEVLEESHPEGRSHRGGDPQTPPNKKESS